MKSWIVIASLAVASPAMLEPREELTPSVMSVSDDIPTARMFGPVTGNDAAMALVEQDSGLPPFGDVERIEVIDCYVDLWSDSRPIMAARRVR